jgi:hypothetical protein
MCKECPKVPPLFAGMFSPSETAQDRMSQIRLTVDEVRPLIGDRFADLEEV